MSDENKPKGPSNEPKGDEGIEEPKPQDGEPGEGDEPKPDEPKPGEGDEPKPDEPKPGRGRGRRVPSPMSDKPGEGEDGEPKDQKPEKAEDYSFAKVLPEGVPEDSPLVAEFKKSAFEHGLSQSQAEAVLAFYGQTKEAELVARGQAHRAGHGDPETGLARRFRQEHETGRQGGGTFRGPAVLGRASQRSLGRLSQHGQVPLPSGTGHFRGHLCAR